MALLIAERGLRDRRRGLFGWALGVAGYVVLQTSFYPSVRSSELQRAIAQYPKELKAFFGGAQSFNFSTGRGYLEVELFSLIVPALLTIAAIGFGAATIAGEQERGNLDLLLANPVTRIRVVAEKATALALTVSALTAIVFGMLVVMNRLVDLQVGLANLAVACVGSALVAFGFGALAMLSGAATGSRPLAIGVPAALFVAAYLIVGLAGLVSWLEPFRVVSPLYHATGTHPLANGLPVANFAILVAWCALTLLATLWIFERRDLAT
jgi:beta-exotoxin I transport system permease protein